MKYEVRLIGKIEVTSVFEVEADTPDEAVTAAIEASHETTGGDWEPWTTTPDSESLYAEEITETI
jgi:hypothetical protein